MHNVQHQLSLMAKVRTAIIEDRYPEFLQNFFRLYYGAERAKSPAWAVEALRMVDVDLHA